MKKLFKSSKPQKGHITPLALPDPQDPVQYQQQQPSHRASESNGTLPRPTQHLAGLLPQRSDYSPPPPTSRQLPAPPTLPIAAQHGTTQPPLPPHTIPRASSHYSSRPSTDGLMNTSDENWIVIPSGLQHPQPQPLRTPSNTHVSSLPPGASPPAPSPYIPASPASILQSTPQSAPQSPPATTKKIANPFSLGAWVGAGAGTEKPELRERNPERERHHGPAQRSVAGHGTENGHGYSLERSVGELDDQSSLHSVDDRREKKGLAGFFGGVLAGDRDRDREQREREKERERAKEDAQYELIRMIGYLTATQSEDWSLVLEVCERASASESSAREAARALRREFK